jgi:hypothetical protein
MRHGGHLHVDAFDQATGLSPGEGAIIDMDCVAFWRANIKILMSGK